MHQSSRCERLEEVLARGGTVVGACSATDLNALREGARSAAQEATLQANNYWAADQPLQSLQRLTTRQVARFPYIYFEPLNVIVIVLAMSMITR